MLYIEMPQVYDGGRINDPIYRLCQVKSVILQMWDMLVRTYLYMRVVRAYTLYILHT